MPRSIRSLVAWASSSATGRRSKGIASCQRRWRTLGRCRCGVCVGTVDDRPDQSTVLIVEVDGTLARDRAVEERNDPVTAIEARVEDEARHQTFIQGAPIAQRTPNLARIASIVRSLVMDAI